ncbi:FixH family protein [Streptosporangium saharense]|uniref:FixH family protein n=1 Tax=Streptosporangium saharense TaxID=1706840 RepID=UPI00341E8B3B
MRCRGTWGAVCAAVLAGAVLWLLWPGGGAEPTVLRNGTEHYRVRLTVERSGTGPVTIDVADLRGRPVTLRSVTVEPVMTNMGHALEPVTTVAQGPGRYRAERLGLPMGGAWALTVLMHGPEGTDRATFPVLVAG